MKSKNIILDKTFKFAVKIVEQVKEIQNTHKEYILSRQLMKSGTSVGANIREAHNAETKKDFIHKMGIAQKECDENKYWLELLFETNYIKAQHYESLHGQATEVLKILRSIIITSKRNLDNL